MAAVRITSGPLRGVELETALGDGRRGALRLLMRALRRRWSSASTARPREVAAPGEPAAD